VQQKTGNVVLTVDDGQQERPYREGKTMRAVVYERYGLEAHRCVETRQKTGNVVLSLNGGPR
jgi:hypothetical protein